MPGMRCDAEPRSVKPSNTVFGSASIRVLTVIVIMSLCGPDLQPFPAWNSRCGLAVAFDPAFDPAQVAFEPASHEAFGEPAQRRAQLGRKGDSLFVEFEFDAGGWAFGNEFVGFAILAAE